MNDNAQLVAQQQAEVDKIFLKRQSKIIEKISQGLLSTPDDVASELSIPLTSAIELLNDPRMIKAIQNYGQVKSNLFFNTKGLQKLTDLAEGEDDKLALSAIQILAKVSNNLKPEGIEVNLNLSLETLVKNREEKTVNRNPVIDLDNLVK